MAYLPPPTSQPLQDVAPKGAKVAKGHGWQALSVTMLPGSHPAQDESAPSEARRIFNKAIKMSESKELGGIMLV